MRYTKRPQGSETIRTYKELEAIYDGYFHGKYNLATIIGRPGLGKSWPVEYRVDGPFKNVAHICKGWAAPLQIHMECFQHLHKLIIFDDAESLWCRAGGRVLLRSLTERKELKLMRWASTAGHLKAMADEMGYDVHEVREYYTSSKVLILGNEFPDGEGSLSGSAAIEYAAVLDRGRIFFFDPSPAEIHRHATWFWDAEIFNYIAQKLSIIHNLSFRLYTKAYEAKVNKEDWKSYIDHHCLDNNKLLARQLATSKLPVPTQLDQWAKKSKNQRGDALSRATYYNYVEELRESGQLKPIGVPNIVIKGKPPKPISLLGRLEAVKEERKARLLAKQEGEDEDTEE